MEEKYVYAIEIKYGEIKKYKCLILKDTEKQLTIKGIYGHCENKVKKNEMSVWGFYIVYEDELEDWLKSKLNDRIKYELKIIQNSEKYIKSYREELAKLN